jgi:hypothetical protein
VVVHACTRNSEENYFNAAVTVTDKNQMSLSNSLNTLIISSTGDMKDQKVYTLDSLQHGGISDVMLASKNLGPADIMLLANLFRAFSSYAGKTSASLRVYVLVSLYLCIYVSTVCIYVS